MHLHYYLNNECSLEISLQNLRFRESLLQDRLTIATCTVAWLLLVLMLWRTDWRREEAPVWLYTRLRLRAQRYRPRTTPPSLPQPQQSSISSNPSNNCVNAPTFVYFCLDILIDKVEPIILRSTHVYTCRS